MEQCSNTSTQKTPSLLLTLPIELIAEILKRCTTVDVNAFGVASRKCNEVAKSNAVWQHHFARSYGDDFSAPTWRDAFNLPQRYFVNGQLWNAATVLNDDEGVTSLIRQGADVNFQDPQSKRSVLHQAVAAGRYVLKKLWHRSIRVPLSPHWPGICRAQSELSLGAHA